MGGSDLKQTLEELRVDVMKARIPVLRSQGEEPTASTGNQVDKEWALLPDSSWLATPFNIVW